MPSSPRPTATFISDIVTAFTTKDEQLAIKLRNIMEEADIACQLVRGLLPSSDGDAHALIEIKVPAEEMGTASQLIDANQSIGHFTRLDILANEAPPVIMGGPIAVAPMTPEES